MLSLAERIVRELLKENVQCMYAVVGHGKSVFICLHNHMIAILNLSAVSKYEDILTLTKM